MRNSCLSKVFSAALCIWLFSACGASSQTASTQSSCLAQSRYIFGGVSHPSSSPATDCSSDSTDGDSISELPISSAPLSHLFLGAGVTDSGEIDDLHTDKGPEAYQLRITSADNFAALSSRSKVTSFLSKCNEAGAAPIITLATLFNHAYTTPSQFSYRVSQDVNIDYFFSQLAALLDLTDSTQAPVTILLEPRLFESFVNSYGESGIPGQVTVPTHLIYDAGYLDKSADPTFDDTLPGFIAATNYFFQKSKQNHQVMAWQVGINSANEIPFLDTFRNQASDDERQLDIHEKAKIWATLTDALGYHSYGLNLLGFKLEGDASSHCVTKTSLTECPPAMNAKDWEALADFLWEFHNESNFSFLLNGVSFGHLEGTLSSETPFDMAGTYLFGGSYAVTDPFFTAYTENSTADNSTYTYVGGGLNALYDSFVVGIVFGDFDARDIDYANDNGWWLTQVHAFDGTQFPVE